MQRVMSTCVARDRSESERAVARFCRPSMCRQRRVASADDGAHQRYHCLRRHFGRAVSWSKSTSARSVIGANGASARAGSAVELRTVQLIALTMVDLSCNIVSHFPVAWNGGGALFPFHTLSSAEANQCPRDYLN